MHDFVLALIGGAMIGLASVVLMATEGRILGISSILSQSLSSFSKDNSWRLSFILGVLAAPTLTILLTGQNPSVQITGNIVSLFVAGLLVGAGTVLGNGCTSGHGVCGISRLSNRSIFATAVFMIAAIFTVWAMNKAAGA